jgi:hypothetical protein
MNNLRICNPFNNVVANGIANVDLNNMLGTTLECINLNLGGTSFTKAMITKIELKANGKVIFETTGSRLDASENFKNYNAADVTKLSINFMENKFRTINGFQAGAIDLSKESGITNLRLEITIAGATAPTLSAIAEVSPALAFPGEENIRFLIKRRHAAQITVGAAGTFSLAVPHLDPAGGGSLYQRIMLYSANATGFKVQRGGYTEYEVTKNEVEWIQRKAGRLPQANLLVFDPILDNIQTGRLWDTRSGSGVSSAQFFATFSAGETITVETEELLPLNAY